MSNVKRILLQPAYVLHRRPYRETSFIVELFTAEHGRIAAVAKGVRKARSPTQGLLQAFTPLIVSWSGRTELMTLTSVELGSQPNRLEGECLYAGFYLNELILALLQKSDPHAGLFASYVKTLNALQDNVLQEGVLRSFEKSLLKELGYGLLSADDVSLLTSIKADQYYRYLPEQGFVPTQLGHLPASARDVFLGRNLLAIAKERWQEEGALQAAKRLIRQVITPLLGNRQIHSRFLFANQGDTK